MAGSGTTSFAEVSRHVEFMRRGCARQNRDIFTTSPLPPRLPPPPPPLNSPLFLRNETAIRIPIIGDGIEKLNFWIETCKAKIAFRSNFFFRLKFLIGKIYADVLLQKFLFVISHIYILYMYNMYKYLRRTFFSLLLLICFIYFYHLGTTWRI